MLFPGTQMHIATFIFVSIEIVILFYLVIYRLARPDDKTAYLNIILIFLLIIYNITGGLLPDSNLPGSYFIQTVIAYATGFITPCYFPYYVYKAFSLEKMKFHAYRGVYLFLAIPYIIFIVIFAISGSLEYAKNLLILPVVYALWVIYTLIKSIRFKYQNIPLGTESKEEFIILLLSLAPWIGLPAIDFFNLGQAIEVSITNFGFLLLFALQVKRHIRLMRAEHERLLKSEKRLLDWNTNLKTEVENRTKELENINEQRTNTFVNLAHETKTPLTLINNYLAEYISKNQESEELLIIKKSINKLSTDIINLFDIEKFNKGFAVYTHNQVCNFSETLNDCFELFKCYGGKKNIAISANIVDEIFIKADPLSVYRIINNLLENAVKYSEDNGTIAITLQVQNNKIYFAIKDSGLGIPIEMQEKVFEPYYQIASKKRNIQGMGLGLPIVKRVIDDLKGEVKIISNPAVTRGTEIIVLFDYYMPFENEIVVHNNIAANQLSDIPMPKVIEYIYAEERQTVLLVEDNITMLNYIGKKLNINYNVVAAVNGSDALSKMKRLSLLPDLIISDVMMDKLDGYSLAKIISAKPLYYHIPFIFLSAKTSHSDKLQGLKLGAIDYIQKPFAISELLQKVESVLLNSGKQKKVVWNKAFGLINSKHNINSQNGNGTFEQNCEAFHLTAREKDIAKLICQGQKYKAIGDALFIAERTVTKHAQNIFEKVEVSNKIELINKLEA